MNVVSSSKTMFSGSLGSKGMPLCALKNVLCACMGMRRPILHVTPVALAALPMVDGSNLQSCL